MTGIDSSGCEGRPLRILTVHRYYWPDTPPYASLLRRIVGRWRQDGHDVEVLSSQPSYKADFDAGVRPKRDRVDGVPVRRLSLPGEIGKPATRIVNALRLGFSVLFRAVIRRYDVIMISTAPPVVGGLAAALGAKLTRARFIYHCMDIHPEVGRVSGEFSRPLVFRALRVLDDWACRRADPVVVLSRDMEDTLRQRRGGDAYHIRVLNNFTLPDDGAVPEQLPFDPSGRGLTVLFAGNIGRFQGLETVVEAMGRLTRRADIEFILMGDGAARAALQEKAREQGARVRFIGHQPVEAAKAAMRNADLGFVSLVPGMFRYAYPSKTMTYLEQGCPLIVSVESESELARDVLAEEYGYTVEVGDARDLAGLLERLADNGDWKAALRRNAYRKARKDFSEAVVLDQWSRLLSEPGIGAR